MVQGHFYFIDDAYYDAFRDPNIQRNHETINGQEHDKPCFYAVPGMVTGLFWIIPISSQVDKYHRIANAKIQKYGRCDTIKFGKVLGYEKAFLIQNMVPITSAYIKKEYLDKTQSPVKVSGDFEQELIKSARSVLEKQRRGVKLIFPDVFAIERTLLATLENAK